MKKRILAAALAIGCMLCACGEIEEESSSLPDDSKAGGDNAVTTITDAEVTTDAKTTTAKEATTTGPTEKPVVDAVIFEFESGSNAVYDSVALIGVSDGASVSKYTSNVSHNDLRGLMGTPLRVDLDGAEEATLVFALTDEELKIHASNVKNYVILRYQEDAYAYRYVPDYEVDMSAGTVSGKIYESGVYFLVNNLLWGSMGLEDIGDIHKLGEDTVMSFEEFGAKVDIPAGILYERSQQAEENYDIVTLKELYRQTYSDLRWLDIVACDYLHYTDGTTFDAAVADVKEHWSQTLTDGPFETVAVDVQDFAIDDGHKGAIIWLENKYSGKVNSYNVLAYYQVDETSFIELQYSCFDKTDEHYEIVTGYLKSYSYD